MTAVKSPADNAYLDPLDQIIKDVIAPAAEEIDQSGTFPRAALEALGQAKLLGLISAKEMGGLGEAHRAATLVVERIASTCASTAMVACMHYAATAVIEAHGPRAVREAIARGAHLTTLAFSEAGSRSHFWAPISTPKRVDGGVQIDAQKSWVTAAGQADSYVWSSRALATDGQISVWLVPADANGLRIPQPFNGLGLRGNASSPVTAEGVIISSDALLGPDGGGFDLMMGVVLPYFQLMSAGFSVGTMNAATNKTVHHVTGTKLEHMAQSLADLPTVRAYLSRMRIKTDMARAFCIPATSCEDLPDQQF
jgi:alkylation response protein AidB-like acyl-CoA dehydrogenase